MGERVIDGSPGYLVFFDNLRVDQYITGFRTSISLSGGMGSASLSFIYAPSFYQPAEDSGLAINSIMEQGFENMTTVRIFSKNMFNNRYIQIFEGNLRGASRIRTSSGYSLSFSVTDYMTWLNRTIVPIQIPFTSQYKDLVDILRWRAQGIDTSKVPTVRSEAERSFKGKKLKEYTSEIIRQALTNNALFSAENTVAKWDNAAGRIYVMGDIDPQLVEEQVVDFIISTTVTSLNSIYVALNDVARNLMFEFYQDRDGIIRIKPPYWNERVLRDHVIDPAMISSVSEDTDYSNFYSRISVSGNLEEYEQQAAMDISGMRTPAVVYVGDTINPTKERIARSTD